MLLQPYIYPEYKFSDKIDYTKPIPPHLLYEETRQLNQETNSTAKRVNHLALLAQTCNRYSQEFDVTLSTIPNLTSPSNQSNSSSCYASLPYINSNINEDHCSKNINNKSKNVLDNDHHDQVVIKKKLKLKKKLKKTKKLSKKKSKKNESPPPINEAEITINNQMDKSQDINIKAISNELTLPPIKSHSNANVGNSEKKSHRFNPYERQKSSMLHQDSNINQELHVNSTSINRTCNWLVNGKVCGLSFRKNDEFNEHIKLHTTNELFTDLTFYYNAKKLLSTTNTSQEMCL